MKTLDLEKLWQIMGKLSWRQEELSQENKYVQLLGNHSSYYASDFEHFLNYYSFKIANDDVVVFNDDSVPYEAYSTGDFSNVPVSLLSLAENDLNVWIDEEVERQLVEVESQKIARKENIKRQIELLQRQLEND